jgi:hypothetical protein
LPDPSAKKKYCKRKKAAGMGKLIETLEKESHPGNIRIQTNIAYHKDKYSPEQGKILVPD